jgi:hypothetical protein
MAISSLKSFGVPVAQGVNQGLLMPKLKYRFRVLLTKFADGAEVTELTKQVMNVTRPDVTFEEIKLSAYNSTIKLAGRHSWADIKLTVRDDVSGQVQKLVGLQLQKQFDFYEQSSAASGVDYKFDTLIQILDGGNGAIDYQVLETFKLSGCYIKQATYSNTDYTSNDPVDISLSIAYDNALQTTEDGDSLTAGGIGTRLGNAVRTLGGATG